MKFRDILRTDDKRELDLEWERRRDELIQYEAENICSGTLIIYLMTCSCLERFGIEMFMDIKAYNFADYLEEYKISTLPIDLYTKSLSFTLIENLIYIIKSRTYYLAKCPGLIEEEFREFAMLQSCLLRIMPEEEN